MTRPAGDHREGIARHGVVTQEEFIRLSRECEVIQAKYLADINREAQRQLKRMTRLVNQWADEVEALHPGMKIDLCNHAVNAAGMPTFTVRTTYPAVGDDVAVTPHD